MPRNINKDSKITPKHKHTIHWDQVYHDFPINEHKIWLNSAGMAPASVVVLNTMNDFLAEFSTSSYLLKKYSFEAVAAKIKYFAGELLRCGEEEVGLVHHTSESFNFLSHGLSFQKGDKIVILEQEYPSNLYPWRHLNEKGVEIVTLAPGNTPEEFFTNLENILDDKTKLLSLSAVHWISGLPFDLEKTGNLCKEKGILFCVDGAQGVGMIDIDVKKCKIDFMAVSGWKWLMGPPGVALFYVSADKLDLIAPNIIGTGSVVDDLQYLPYKEEYKKNADRFTTSTPSLQDWVYLMASLEFLHLLGFERVRNRIYDLADKIVTILKESGFTFSRRDPLWPPSGTVSARHPDIDSEELFRKLSANGIIASHRGDYVRFSPHIHNHEEQFIILKQVLKNLLHKPEKL